VVPGPRCKSHLLDIRIDLSFAEGEETQVAAAAAASDGAVLIAWQHEGISTIADAIPGKGGIVPPSWPGARFDIVWVFDPQSDGTYPFSQLAQQLPAGDLSTVI
jgi:hypothetical protein